MPQAFKAKFEGAFSHDTKDTINKNFLDVSQCTAEVDVTSSTTLVNVTGMQTGTLNVGTYSFFVNLATAAGASGGVKVAFLQDSLIAVSTLQCIGNTSTASAFTTQLTQTTTSQTSLVSQTAAVLNVQLTGTIVITTPGTLTLQFAQNASNSTASSVLVGSYMEFQQIA